MAADRPLSRIVLAAASVADDLGYVALADMGRALGADRADYRVIGGHMVTTLVARWQLGAELYRATGDTDFGVPRTLVLDRKLVDRLRRLGYAKVAGNRFVKPMRDIPVGITGASPPPQGATIDVLVPAYTSRARDNLRVGPDLVTTEVRGLATALNRQPIVLSLELHRLNGKVLQADLCFPDEVGALVLKAYATGVRAKGTDIVDIWRCLEVCFAAGVRPKDFTGTERIRAAGIVRDVFASRAGSGMEILTREQRLSREAADQRYTRIRALVARVVGVE